MGGVGVEIFFGFLELGALAFFDAGAVEVEVDGLGAAEEIAINDEAIGTGLEIGTCFSEASVKTADTDTSETTAILTEDGRARVRPGGFFDAAGEGYDGAEESDGEGLREEVHERKESRQWLTLLSNGIASASHLSLRAIDS